MNLLHARFFLYSCKNQNFGELYLWPSTIKISLLTSVILLQCFVIMKNISVQVSAICEIVLCFKQLHILYSYYYALDYEITRNCNLLKIKLGSLEYQLNYKKYFCINNFQQLKLNKQCLLGINQPRLIRFILQPTFIELSALLITHRVHVSWTCQRTRFLYILAYPIAYPKIHAQRYCDLDNANVVQEKSVKN